MHVDLRGIEEMDFNTALSEQQGYHSWESSSQVSERATRNCGVVGRCALPILPTPTIPSFLLRQYSSCRPSQTNLLDFEPRLIGHAGDEPNLTKLILGQILLKFQSKPVTLWSIVN